MEELEIEETSLKIDLKIHGVIEDTFSKKVMFLLTIIDKSIEYIKYRSHIDFALLRSNLSKKWISLTVPCLCKISSSILKTHEDRHLEAKKKYFYSFLLECISIPAILNSSDFQLFIKGPDNFGENAKAAAPDFRNIYTKYQILYKPLSGIQYTLSSIQEFYEKYKTTSVEIKNQKKIIKQLFEKLESMKENHKNSYTKLALLSQNYINILNNSDLEPQLADYNIQINPYNSLLEWITKENLILKSIIESIEKFFEWTL